MAAMWPSPGGGQEARVVGTGDGSRVAAECWAEGWGGRGPPSLLCPALLWVQMIESECFKDINESENEPAVDEPVVVLAPDEKMSQQVPRQKRGFFHRLFSRGVRVRPPCCCCFNVACYGVSPAAAGPSMLSIVSAAPVV